MLTSFASDQITAEKVAALIKDKNKVAGKDYAIVDVRDDDHEGGQITGSIHCPSEKFLTDIPKLLEQVKDVPIVIFHCALSQIRGPRCARRYVECRSLHGYNAQVTDGNARDAALSLVTQKVYVLRDGFVGFQRLYKDDPRLVKDWQDVWD